MTPLGHAAISYMAGNSYKRLSVPAVLLGGFLPDIDFFLLPFSFFDSIHRVVTHNLLFLALAGGVIFFIYRNHPRRYIILLSMALGIILHFFADSIMDANMQNGTGIALFWPFSNYFFSPFNLVEPIPHSGWDQPALQAKITLQKMGWELLMVLPVVMFLLLKRFYRIKTKS